MFKNLGFQLYTIRDFVTDPDLAEFSLKKLASYGYSEIHGAGEYLPVEQLAAIAKEKRLHLCGQPL